MTALGIHGIGFIALQIVLIFSCLTEQNSSFIFKDDHPEKDSRRNNDNEQYLKFWTHIINSPNQPPPAALNGTSANTNSVIVESGVKLGLFLWKFADMELGIQETKTAYESVSFDAKQRKDPMDQVQTLASKLSAEMKVYQDALDRMVAAAKLSYDEAERQDDTLPLCCDLTPQTFQFDDYYKTLTSMSTPCWTRPVGQKKIFVPGKAFSNVLLENNERIPNLKWQYFVSPDGVQVQFPSSKQNCPKKNESRSSSFMSGKPTPERKSWLIQKSSSDTQIHKIIFLIQLDENTDSFVIKSIKNIVFQLLKLLDESDEVGIISSESDQLWANFICDQMLKTSSWTRFQIINYIAYLENRYKTTSPPRSTSDGTNDDSANPDHYMGLKKAISMACQNSSETSNMFPPCATTIIQLSSSGIDVSKFRSKSLNVNCPVFIESLFLKPYNQSQQELFRRTMQNVASRNIWRIQVFSVEQTDPNSFAEKVALQLSTKKEWWSFSDILSQFFPQETNYSQNLREFSLPNWNPVSKELVVAAKRFVFHNGRPLGLISVEIPLVAFTQHIVAFNDDDNVVDAKNYVFLIDKNGKIVLHPAFGKPELSKGLFSSVSIEQVEVYKGFSSLKKRILSEKTGCASLHSGGQDTWITYTWTSSFNYIIVLTLFGDSGGCSPAKHEFILRKNALSTSEVQHHLLLDKRTCCRNQLVSLNKAGLYLAPTAFLRPADVSRDESNQNFKRMLSLMAYIGDHSGMIQNPRGELNPSVKHHIGVLAPSVQIWKQRYFQSDWNRYILRRFASGGTGTFLLIYPGHQISSGYLPNSAKWYRKAVSGEGKLMFLPPRFDIQGRLPVVTLSQVISLDLKTPFSQVVHKTPVAVVGADMHAGFLRKLVDDILPECNNLPTYKSHNSNNSTSSGGTGVTRCFLVDESGVVIYHPHLTGSVQTDVHLTQVEPLSVVDILQQSQTSHSLLKYMCHKVSETSVTQGSLKRMYKFLINERGISKQHGELCNVYHLVPVPGTNLILGVVRENCSSATAFCPCSRVDNLCLNCLRMEQSDCECPCECPREPSFCTRKGFADLPDNIVPCEFPFEDLPMLPVDAEEGCQENETQYVDSMCAYAKTSCSSITEATLCKGSWDCEWCLSNLTVPTCLKYSDCYDLTNEKVLQFTKEVATLRDDSVLYDKDNHSAKYDSQITMVPVLVVLSVFIVFIAFVIYCYRHRALSMSESQPNLYLLPLQDNLAGVASPAVPDHCDSDSDADNVGLVVPVVRGNVRHPPVAVPPPPRSPVASTVSDLGYSTMTGENISECGAGPCMAYSIPLPKSRESRLRPAAGEGSTHKNHSSRLDATTEEAFDRKLGIQPLANQIMTHD